MSDAGDFIDLALQREASWSRAEESEARYGSGQRYYGASVGAVRGTVRDALRRHPGLTHDDITALSSELWEVPVFERRLAGVVLLQSSVRLLTNTDLTRIEGFVRSARLGALVDPLAVDVVGPLIAGLDVVGRVRADSVLDRWVRDPDGWLRRPPCCPRSARSVPARGTGRGSCAMPVWCWSPRPSALRTTTAGSPPGRSPSCLPRRPGTARSWNSDRRFLPALRSCSAQYCSAAKWRRRRFPGPDAILCSCCYCAAFARSISRMTLVSVAA